ncbi:MAG: hypothetical protein HRT36_04555 [Alphaproteobacteria bacterium]|nr:hypothetical protein [Alphaproteobacteria bacterium]
MFKMLILWALYTLPDDQTEFAIGPCAFWDLVRGTNAKTIWLFREHLKEKDEINKTVRPFWLRPWGSRLTLGMDASIIKAPRQRNTHETTSIKASLAPRPFEKTNPSRCARKIKMPAGP